MKRKKLGRQCVKRVLMGPSDMFTPEIIQEDIGELSVWGVLLQDSNPLDVTQFVSEMFEGNTHDVYIGRVSASIPTNLTKPQQWIVKEFLNFGEAEVGAQVLCHVSSGHCD